MPDGAHTSGDLEQQSSDAQQELDRLRVTPEGLTGALCTIHALRTHSPELRVVAASGLHGNGKTNHALSARVGHLLSQPDTSLGLLRATPDARADRAR